MLAEAFSQRGYKIVRALLEHATRDESVPSNRVALWVGRPTDEVEDDLELLAEHRYISIMADRSPIAVRQTASGRQWARDGERADQAPPSSVTYHTTIGHNTGPVAVGPQGSATQNLGREERLWTKLADTEEVQREPLPQFGVVDEHQVRAMIADGESEAVEFKKSLAEQREALETLAAFASQRGGTVVFGVSPQGKVVGLSIGTNTVENLASAIRASIDPLIFPTVDLVNIDGLVLVTVTTRADGRPYTCNSRFYRRVGRSTNPAPLDEYVRQLLPFRPDLAAIAREDHLVLSRPPKNDSGWQTYLNGRFGFLIEFPADWPRGREADNGDGARLYDGEPEILVSAWGSHYSYHSAPYSGLGLDDFTVQPTNLDDGTRAQLLQGRKDDKFVLNLVVVARGVEFHVYAKVATEFLARNQDTVLRVMKGLKILTPVFRSGSIGLDQRDWEDLHGQPFREDGGFRQYEGGKFVAVFMEGKVWHVERIYGDRGAVLPEVARDESCLLMPADARFIRDYRSRSGMPVYVWHSSTLKDRFAQVRWTGGEPGDFIVIYRIRADGLVTSGVIGLGNNSG